MTVEVLGTIPNFTLAHPDNTTQTIPLHSGETICFVIFWDYECPIAFPQAPFTVTLDGVAPTTDAGAEYLGTTNRNGCFVYVWSMDDLESMPNYDATGFTANLQINGQNDGSKPVDRSYLPFTLKNVRAATPVRQVDENLDNVSDDERITGTLAALEGDFAHSVWINESANRYLSSVDQLLSSDQGQDVATDYRHHRCSGTVGVGGFNDTVTYFTDLSAGGTCGAVTVLFTGTEDTVTYSRVLKSTTVVTEPQPGQELQGLRPGDRVSIFDGWRVSEVGRVLHDLLELHDDLQVEALSTLRRIKTDSVAILSDTLRAKFFGSYGAVLFDVMQTADFKRMVYSWSRDASDAFSVNDAYRLAYALTRPLIEVDLELYDAFIGRLDRTRALPDYVQLSESVIESYISPPGEPSIIYTRLKYDQFAITERLRVDRGRVLSEALGLSDVLTKRLQVRHVVRDSVELSDRLTYNAVPPIEVGLERLPVRLALGGFTVELGVLV